jgi:flagellar biosynthesis/type III secretory pathway chaperone
MSAMATESGQVDDVLTGEVLTHLRAQLESARRLQAIVAEQSAAIRHRAVPQIVRLAGELQVEMHRREILELERSRLVQRAATDMAVPVADVTIMVLSRMMDGEAAEIAHERTVELRALLSQIQREHQINRALMQQELAFLDHLLRLAGGTGSYDSGGDHTSASRTRALTRRPLFDLEA